MLIRIGLPTPTGAIPVEVERLDSPALVSAGALWDKDRRRFRAVPFGLADLDLALDSAGFVAHVVHGDYPWNVDAYVELAGSWGWAWWSQMDYACEAEIARDQAEVRWRVHMSAVLLRACRYRARDWREQGATWLQDPMPILQGQAPESYLRSVEEVDRELGGTWPALIGIGSMCRRHVEGDRGIFAVLKALEPVVPRGTRYHLFGVKGQALDGLRGHPRIESVDSQAWDRAARWRASKEGRPCDMALKTEELHRWHRAQVVEGRQPSLFGAVAQVGRAGR